MEELGKVTEDLTVLNLDGMWQFTSWLYVVWTVLQEAISSCLILVLSANTDCAGEVWIFNIFDVLPEIFCVWLAFHHKGRSVLSILDFPQTT
jgi:hypothetical protein